MSGAGLALPPAGGVSDQTVAFAAELIDRSGKAPVIEAALAHATGGPARCRSARYSQRCSAWRWMTARCSSPRPPGSCSSG